MAKLGEAEASVDISYKCYCCGLAKVGQQEGFCKCYHEEVPHYRGVCRECFEGVMERKWVPLANLRHRPSDWLQHRLDYRTEMETAVQRMKTDFATKGFVMYAFPRRQGQEEN